MKLEIYLRKQIEKEIQENWGEINSIIGKSLEELNHLNWNLENNKARFSVQVQPTEENSNLFKTTISKYKGTLEGAIKNAKRVYFLINKHKESDKNLKYSVQIALGDKNYDVPEEYWNEFISSD